MKENNDIDKINESQHPSTPTNTTQIPWRPDATKSLALDYAKSIGIIAVVMGHYAGNPFNIIQIYMYHMPLFFFIGGILFNPAKTLASFYSAILKKHILYIITTYIIIGVAIKALLQVYHFNTGDIFKSGVVDTILFALSSNFHGNAYFLVAWFLLAYAAASCFAYHIISIIQITAKSEQLQNSVAALLAMVLGYIGMTYISAEYNQTKLQALNFATQSLVGSSFMLLGYSLRKYIWRVQNLYAYIVLFLIVMALGSAGYKNNIGISWSQYKDGFIASYAKALIGIYSVFFIANLLAASQNLTFFRKIGAQSKTIMSYHLISFLILDIIFYHMGLYEIKNTKTFGHYNTPWVYGLYIIIGVTCPMLIGIGIIKAKSLIKQVFDAASVQIFSRKT